MGTTTPPFKKIQPFKEIKDILPNDSRLVITGRVPREEAMRISNEANIFLTPSRREGCPMALLEAMRVGTIPITSDYNNACKEIIKDGYNGYVIPHKNISGFIKRIKDIIRYPDRYNEIYDNSYKTYQAELSFTTWKKAMDALLNVTNCRHKKRHDAFDRNLFSLNRKKQNRLSKYNMLHLLIYEYLPSALCFYKHYFNYITRRN